MNEIKKAIKHLSVEERLDLMQWLDHCADDEWDRQMKRDAAAGKFNRLIKEAETDYREGRTGKGAIVRHCAVTSCDLAEDQSANPVGSLLPEPTPNSRHQYGVSDIGRVVCTAGWHSGDWRMGIVSPVIALILVLSFIGWALLGTFPR